MRITLLSIVLSLLLSSCYTQKQQHPLTPQAYLLHKPKLLASNFFNHQHFEYKTNVFLPAKDPSKITVFLNETKLTTPYRVIGVGKISKYSLFGKERNLEKLNEMMKQLAAAVGGDALVAVNFHDDILEAEIIAYQKVLI